MKINGNHRCFQFGHKEKFDIMYTEKIYIYIRYMWTYIREALILGIFEFLCSQMLIWFGMNKNKHPQVSSLYLNFNICRTAMQVSHLIT